EAGVLGVPWIFLSSSGRCFLDEQQGRYGLGRWTNSLSVASDQAAEWLSRKDLKEVWCNKRRVMLEEKEDVTRFILDFIRGWPRSCFAAESTRPSNLDATRATGYEHHARHCSDRKHPRCRRWRTDGRGHSKLRSSEST